MYVFISFLLVEVLSWYNKTSLRLDRIPLVSCKRTLRKTAEELGVYRNVYLYFCFCPAHVSRAYMSSSTPLSVANDNVLRWKAIA